MTRCLLEINLLNAKFADGDFSGLSIDGEEVAGKARRDGIAESVAIGIGTGYCHDGGTRY